MKVHHLEFKVIWEDWNFYKLENNLILKAKNPINRIIEQPETNSGEAYKIDFDILQKIEGDIDLHDPSNDTEIRPEDILKQVTFEPLEERVQIYYIPKYKDVFLTKPIIKKISSTSKYDNKGYPIFSIDSGIMMTSVRVP